MKVNNDLQLHKKTYIETLAHPKCVLLSQIVRTPRKGGTRGVGYPQGWDVWRHKKRKGKQNLLLIQDEQILSEKVSGH